jgi:phenylacetate-CoA ligase
MQRAFRAPVYDQYGCGEVFWLAAQCAASEHLHIFSDTRCIEFLDDNGRAVGVGDYGQIAITDLENYVFPLIRYVNGDSGSAIAGQCACGVNLPLMAAVKGRTTDRLRLPDGGIIAGDYLTTIFDTDPTCVRAFQIFQKHDFSIDVRVVLNPAEFGADERISRAVAGLRAKVHGLVHVRAVHVTNIDSDRGKTRWVVSER